MGPEARDLRLAHLGRSFVSLFLYVPVLTQLLVLVVMLGTTVMRAGSVVSWPLTGLAAVLGGAIALRDAKRGELPREWAWRYGPALGVLLAVVVVRVVDMHLSRGEFTRPGLPPLVPQLLFLPWVGIEVGVAGGGSWVVLAIPSLAYAGYLGFLAWGSRREPATGRRATVPAAALFTVLALLAGWQFHLREQRLAPPIAGIEVGEEVPLYQYRPFSPRNRLVKVPAVDPPFGAADAPRLDGATGAYPLYAAMVQAFYTPEAANRHVAVSRTARAYERLIAGEVDAIFVAQPSEAHAQLARERGVPLQLTPVARDAFVFLVSEANPVRGLSADQVRRIYLGEIRHWNEVGGPVLPIVAYQRPENSGSQTVMKARVMHGQAMRPALEEEVAQGMGGLVRRVAAYRNAPQSLGYSFRFYVTRMQQQAGLRLLAIDGVPPTSETIRSGSYPYTVDLYMVTSDRSQASVNRLREWLLGPQGQQLVEGVGLVRLM